MNVLWIQKGVLVTVVRATIKLKHAKARILVSSAYTQCPAVTFLLAPSLYELLILIVITRWHNYWYIR